MPNAMTTSALKAAHAELWRCWRAIEPLAATTEIPVRRRLLLTCQRLSNEIQRLAELIAVQEYPS